MNLFPIHAVESSVSGPARIPIFPKIPPNTSVVHHTWEGLPEFWDGNFHTLRLQMVTPGFAGKAFTALANEGRCLNINALPHLMQTDLPEEYEGKFILIAGTILADLRTGQQYVQGISTINRKSTYKLHAGDMVKEKTFTLVFKD